jgi:hypothetical protein
MVGFPATKADFDSRAGQLATSLRDDLARWNQFFTLLTSSQWGSNNLQTVVGYSAADAATLIAAATDLGGSGISLYNIAHGGALPTGPNDFFFNAKLLTGVV